MERKPEDEQGADAGDLPGDPLGDLISSMGRERMALRAKRATVVLTAACSFVCLGTALGGFTGRVLPHAPGPATVFLVCALAGFILSVLVARRA